MPPLITREEALQLGEIEDHAQIEALLRAESELPADIEEELIELRRASFASQDLREGMRAFAERRPARWRGE